MTKSEDEDSVQVRKSCDISSGNGVPTNTTSPWSLFKGQSLDPGLRGRSVDYEIFTGGGYPSEIKYRLNNDVFTIVLFSYVGRGSGSATTLYNRSVL